MAGAVRGGAVPYRDFGFEYPPLALVPVVVAGGSALLLALLMLAALLATQLGVGALGGRRAAWLFALAPLLCGALVRTHFDALPTALAIGGLVALARGRPRWGFAVLALGAMAKLWPLLLVPVAAVWLRDRRAALAGLAVTLAVCAAVLAPFAGGGLLDALRFQTERPVQIESSPASVLFAVGESSVTGAPVRPDRFKSNGLDGGPADLVSALFLVALGLGLAATLALARRDLVLASFAAVLAFVALGRVLSPQYVVWLAPFAALAWTRGARIAAALTALAIATTQLEFPSRYFDLVAADRTTIAIVAARNGLLLAALGALLAALALRPRAAD